MYINMNVIDCLVGTEFFSLCSEINQLPVSHLLTAQLGQQSFQWVHRAVRHGELNAADK